MNTSDRRTARRTALLAAVAVSAVGVITVTLPHASAQDADAQAEQVLRAVSDYYGSLDSMSFTAVMERHQRVPAQGFDQRASIGFSFAVQRPNKLAMRPVEEGQPSSGVIVSDGENLSVHVPELAKYTVDPSPATFDEMTEDQLFVILSGQTGPFIGWLLAADPYTALTEDATAIRYVGREAIDGVQHDHVRLENAEMPIDLWVAAGEKPIVTRIAPDLTRILARAREAGQDIEMEMTVRLSDWRADPQLADDRFAFTPPEGAEKVASFFQEPEPPIEVGAAAPDFTLEQLSGGDLSLASHKGQNIVILDFWATWCGPCRQAMPILSDVAGKFRDKSVVLYGVNIREDKQTIRGFLEEEELDLNVLLDRDGSVAMKYGARSIPQTVIIGKDGTVQAVHVGYSPRLRGQLTRELETLAAGGTLAD